MIYALALFAALLLAELAARIAAERADTEALERIIR